MMCVYACVCACVPGLDTHTNRVRRNKKSPTENGKKAKSSSQRRKHLGQRIDLALLDFPRSQSIRLHLLTSTPKISRTRRRIVPLRQWRRRFRSTTSSSTTRTRTRTSSHLLLLLLARILTRMLLLVQLLLVLMLMLILIRILTRGGFLIRPFVDGAQLGFGGSRGRILLDTATFGWRWGAEACFVGVDVHLTRKLIEFPWRSVHHCAEQKTNKGIKKTRVWG